MAVRTVGGFTLPVSVEGELHTPSKDSSCNVRLELKIKRVKHGKEIPFTGADYQEAGIMLPLRLLITGGWSVNFQ